MKIKVSLIGLLSIFVLFSSALMTGQSHKLPAPKMASDVDALGVPPPPGLKVPIDLGIPGVMAGGLFIGIYFLRNRKITSPTR